VLLVGLDDARVEGCTIAANGTSWGSTGLAIEANTTAVVERSIVWGNCAQGAAEISVADGSSADFRCVTLDPATVAGSAVTMSDLLAADPLFCEAAACADLPDAGGRYTLDPASPVLLQACGPMGAQEAGCGSVSVKPQSWARIKAAYR